MICIVDAWAWIEYFAGSKKGSVLKKILENKNNRFITMDCTLSEVKSYCLRTDTDFNSSANIIKRNSIVLPVLLDNWLEASEVKHEMREKFKDFGLIDSILIAKQKEHNCQIISGDRHFKGLRNVKYIGD